MTAYFPKRNQILQAETTQIILIEINSFIHQFYTTQIFIEVNANLTLKFIIFKLNLAKSFQNFVNVPSPSLSF